MTISLEEVYRLVAASPFNTAIGGNDPALVGEGQSNILVRLPGFGQPRRILDYGCGIGRTMPALYSKLGYEGVELDGCDISEDFVAECRRLYGSAYPFRFFKIFAENEHYASYHTTSRQDAVPLAYYDFCYSYSVFTHFDIAMAAKTLDTLRLFMRGSGRYYFTMFRLDDQSADIVARNASPLFKFQAPYKKGQAEYFAVPSDRLAFAAMSKESIEGEILRTGWKVVEFYPGAWRDISMPNSHDAYLIERA